MDFSLNEDQQLLQTSIRRYLRDCYDFEARQRTIKSGEGFSPEYWRSFAELGWLGVSFAEEDGGLGGGPVELMMLCQALGEHLVIEPVLENLVLAGGLIRRLGSAEQRAHFLPALMAGSLQCAVAHGEAGAGVSPELVTTTATRSGMNYVIEGEKCVVYNAPNADLLLVTARSVGRDAERAGINLFAIPADTAGIRSRNYSTIDGRCAAELCFDGVTVDAATRLGREGEAGTAITATLDDALLAISAEAVGAMQALLDTTLAYTRERKQFGVAISSFQVLQHKMVDMYMALEKAQSLLMVTAVKLRDGSEDAHMSVAALKVLVDRAGRQVAHDAVQLHGGIAMTDELPVGHYLKRLTVLSYLLGSTEHHLRRYTELQAGFAG